jgi:transcription termination/antitermination protein NusG
VNDEQTNDEVTEAIVAADVLTADAAERLETAELVAEAADEAAAEAVAEGDDEEAVAIQDEAADMVTELVTDAATELAVADELVTEAADAEAHDRQDVPMLEALEASAEVHELADEAVEVTIAEAAEEAVVLADAGDTEAADEVLVDAAIEAAVMEQSADEIGEELVHEAAEREEAIVEEEHLEMEAAQGDGELPVEAAAPAEPEVPASDDPFRGPGDWYVVHTYAGYENKVKANLESRIHTMQMEGKIFRVHIPMEDVMEIKNGKKQIVQKKVFPGYLLVKMEYDNDSWYVVRNTPGVTGFVSAGTGQKPTPLSKREIEKILVVKKEEAKPAVRLGFDEGDVVRITSGPFADFNGTISEINADQAKLKVLVNIFDRETPVELAFDQVAKV